MTENLDFGYTDMREKLFYDFVDNLSFICQMDFMSEEGKYDKIK